MMNKVSFLNDFLNRNKTLRDCVIAVICWLSVFFLINRSGLPDDYILSWIFIVFIAIPLYGYASSILIPSLKNRSKGFWFYQLKFLKILFIALIPVITVFSLLSIRFIHISIYYPTIILFTAIDLIFHLMITSPISWIIFEYRLAKENELKGLKTTLGQSTANIEFLRSQINPHFLFNALNTLYGTAIQENSERTAQGIQKLGDIMRFMLHENNQDKILLEREIDYIRNYIDLQLLRTKNSPEILVETDIADKINGQYISPMLLIPFIENAFKHGISLTHRSWIKITLYIDMNKLCFDVYNSIHPKTGIDPEKDKSGIGLENVKQRLQLIYPGHHELIIRESEKEFFIHLTIQLA